MITEEHFKTKYIYLDLDHASDLILTNDGMMWKLHKIVSNFHRHDHEEGSHFCSIYRWVFGIKY